MKNLKSVHIFIFMTNNDLTHKNLICLILIIFTSGISAQSITYKNNQPFSSYWHVDEVINWSSEKDKHAQFNISYIPLASRSLNDKKRNLDSIPKIVSLIAPHPTSNYPSQGFKTIKQYAFPYWQYIDYFVQWGGAANEGIIVPPNATWTDAAHKNGVPSFGTIFFPPNVYGGKEEWVYQFLKQNEEGDFLVADKLIEIANTYNFDGWFINQETHNLEKDAADLMLKFITYFKRNSSLKLVWYDAMIADGRVIWQDELNHHNQMFFQQDEQRMSDLFFINFRYSATNLEDSNKLARKLGRSPWDLYAGIDVQSKSFKTPVPWETLFEKSKPKNTSVGLYWPNSTFDISETKQPEDVYKNEQQFWIGGATYNTRFGEKTWQGFANYFSPRTVINSLPFKSNFNYGLGRFYNEKGKRVSEQQWHNLSIQDILPTYQNQLDSTKVKTSFNFSESYEGGSSFQIQSAVDTLVPLYKTAISLERKIFIEVVTKNESSLKLEFYYKLSTGKIITKPLSKSKKWNKDKISITKNKGFKIVELGVKCKGNGTAFLGELLLYNSREKELPEPNFTVESFRNETNSELYVHFEPDVKAPAHTIYLMSQNKSKIWLGKTFSEDYYISQVPINNNGTISLIIEPMAHDGSRGKAKFQKINVK